MNQISARRRTPGQLILVRHAESRWNTEQRFTGWSDIALTLNGRRQARAAGRTIAATGIRLDAAFVSRLQRARDTLALIQEEVTTAGMAVTTAWELNERHYGSLQGAFKLIVSAEQGEHKVNRWRRGYVERPPQMPKIDPAHPVHDPLYADVNPERLPSGESLQETRHRVVEHYHREIRPLLQAGHNVLVVSHGNTLRALVMELEMLTVPQVEALEIGMAECLLYRFDAEFEIAGKMTLAAQAPADAGSRAA
jgi:2,3-bisphosphoglycerate-dependent phosphoglycerate mutase